MVTKAKDYGDTATLEKPLTYEKNTSDSEKRKLKHMMLKVNRGSYNFVKRTIDIVGGSIGCLFLLPIAGVIKIANLASGDKAPILLTQKRIGKGGKEFKFYKFRSMVPNADEELKRLMATDPAIKEEYTKNKKLKHDPRITPVGKVIRRTSIDELPQLINVVKGDMSIVGNRPYLPREKEDMGKYYNSIIKTTPGITGYWQISGRSDVSFEKRLELEKYYSHNYSLNMDAKILSKTIGAVIGSKGAK